MTEVSNKVAFVTGAASGIGLALVKSLLSRGCKVMMADINRAALEQAQRDVGHEGQTATVICDVADADSVKAAAQATLDTFGKVHLVFNNAGVSLAGRPGQISLKDWRWITDINVLGIVYGCETFIPLIMSHGEGGHITNTASMAGHVASIGMGPYFATKFAAVGYSEALFQELAPAGIGVSCLCPTWVKSNIHNTSDQSPDAAKTRDQFKASKAYEAVKALVENGMDAERYAELAMSAIAANRLHVFNDPDARDLLVARQTQLLADYDANLKDLGL
ncbi:SDR family NAD(P)-dependent oxidoreductase [Litorimonas sp. RW-G-Af-16]|uniref:SDR family NAD(P)-dependent oxidoreductase n=1 Tax=Litorimonas sp. RW-G-Af-16 TaxID=3241168 RepID=UPI00390CA823